MNSQERLAEIQRFQTWLYDLPSTKQVGPVGTKSVSLGNPFEPGAVDEKELAMRERNELRFKRASKRSKSLVVNGPRLTEKKAWKEKLFV